MREAVDFIRRHPAFIVASHVNPDGDAIGAMLGLVSILKAIGKNATPYNPDPVPGAARFLPGAHDVLHALADLPPAPAVIVLDAGDLGRAGPGFPEALHGRPLLNIDHHRTNDHFGTDNWVDPHASSTGEMILDLARALDAPLSPDAALCLYTAILTDTGSFHFSNATAKTIRAAANLVAAGANPELAATGYYHSHPPERLPLLRRFLNSMDYRSNQAQADAVLSLQDYHDLGVGPDLSENFINFLLDVASVRVAVFYRQTKTSSWKVSLRSKGNIDISVIAKQRGGGGHQNAAGCELSGQLDAIKTEIRSAVDRLLQAS